jgi:hypothetical protein
MNKTHPNMWAFIACLQGEEVIFLTTIRQAQGGLAKEKGAEDIGHAGTNRQFGHSLLQ